MTALKELLLARLERTGPMSLNEYMAECLLHPEHGYYATRDPFGASGDFITAPEISQMFGELIGLCLAQAWIDQGKPSPFTLAELGPGRGTLMMDALRATTNVTGFHDAAQITLIEASPTLRDIQAATLEGYNVNFLGSVSDISNQPLFLVANEFFDALPIRQFHRSGDLWRELQVACDEDKLAFGLSAPAPMAELSHRIADTGEGAVVETCPQLAPIVHEISTRIAEYGGGALIIDYGDQRSLGDTLQALRSHEPVHPLEHCGDADLTAHVDFEAIARAAVAAGAAPSALSDQRDFLGQLGISERASQIAEKLSGDALEAHVKAFERLTSEAEMGTLFKVLALKSSPETPIAGFAS